MVVVQGGDDPMTDDEFCEASNTGRWHEVYARNSKSRTRVICDDCGRQVRLTDGGCSMDHMRPHRRSASANMPTDATLQACADIVEFACRDLYVQPGAVYVRPKDVWVDPRDIRSAAARSTTHPTLPDKFGSAMLQRAAKAGLIVARNFAVPFATRNEWRFTTLELAAAWDAERALTDGERAERTVAAVRGFYADNMRQYGDSVALWPVSEVYGMGYPDGIRPAVDGGLLREVNRSGSNGLVPAEEWDAFTEALTAEQVRAARLKSRTDDLRARLHVHTGGSINNLRSLDAAQMQHLLDLIEPADQ